MGEDSKYMHFGTELGLESMVTASSPFHVKDDIGITKAVLQLMMTQDKGRCNKFVHHSTAREFRSGF